MNDHYYFNRTIKKISLRTKILIVSFLLIVCLLALIFFDIGHQNEQKPVSSKVTTSVEAGQTNIMTTRFFQLQAPKNWINISSESTNTMYVYRQLNGSLIQRELKVYVNSPEKVRATRVMPIKLNNNGDLVQAGSVSGHCRGREPATGHRTDVEIRVVNNISMNCYLESPEYSILLGVAGGGTDLNLKRPNGQIAKYTIFYRDATTEPDFIDLQKIVETFQTR